MKPRKITPYPLYNTDNPLLSDHANELDIFLGKPFWIWDEKEHSEQFIKTNGKCCHVDILERLARTSQTPIPYSSKDKKQYMG